MKPKTAKRFLIRNAWKLSKLKLEITKSKKLTKQRDKCILTLKRREDRQMFTELIEVHYIDEIPHMITEDFKYILLPEEIQHSICLLGSNGQEYEIRRIK